jgi:phospholipase/lecithinase/hemolysin
MRLPPRALCLLFAVASALPLSAAPLSRLYVFGDSYSDFGAGYVDCDGPTAVAYLAWNLGLEFTHAKAPKAADKSLDFAVSGAQTGEGEGRHVKDALLGYGMANQVRDFAARVKSGEIHFDPATTLFFIAGGLNDRMLKTEVTIANLRQEIETLKSLGAQHFTVALLPTKIQNYSAVGNRLNPAFAQLAKDAHEQLGVDIWINHWGSYYDEVMDHPASYGIINTTAKCAGRGIYDEDTTPVGDPATFFFYHNNHPSTAVHRIVGKKLAEEVSAQAAHPAGQVAKP